MPFFKLLRHIVDTEGWQVGLSLAYRRLLFFSLV